MTFEKELKVAKEIAFKAGDIMLEYFDAEQGLEHKTDINTASEVTIADKKINRLVIEEFSKYFNDGIIGEEESTSNYGPGRKWICDPIDGTKAFVIGVPTAMFSLGLVVDGVPVLGVMYDPFLGKLYWGIKGQGSYCNDNRLTVSNDKLSGSYVLVADIEKIAKKPAIVTALQSIGAKPETVYGAVYKSSLVAQGRVCGYIEKEIQPHDIAAAHIVVEEAGGKVTGYDGKPLDYSKHFRGAVISNTTTHQELLDCLVK